MAVNYQDKPVGTKQPSRQQARKRDLLTALVSTSALIAALSAHGQTLSWEGGSSTDWFDGSNWDNGTVPTTFTDVVIDTTSPHTTTLLNPGAVSDRVVIGDTGSGYLTISRNGTLSSELAYLGTRAGSTGTAEVAGMGDRWTVSDLLLVGLEGTGRLHIKNGATVRSGWGSIGHADAGSKVTVSGHGSTWINDSGVAVGSADSLSGTAGTGALDILNGGNVIGLHGVIARYADSQGSVTVSGTDSRWSNSELVYVGWRGTGTLTVDAGGAVVSGTGFIGKEIGAEGAVMVTGAGSRWVNNGVLYVGEFGKGALTVANGGLVSNWSGSIGREKGSEGTALVTGTGSTWTSNGFFLVGDQGTGALTVADGAEAISLSQVRIGDRPNSLGTVTVTGTDSRWRNADQLAVGFWGNGSLLIENGGTVSGAAYASIATWDDSEGQITVSGAGSLWESTGELHVGLRGVGILSVEDGAVVKSGQSTIGGETGSEGLAVLTGSGSTWALTGDLFVGYESTGTLNILDGAAVSSGGLVSVADQAGSSGSLLVNGNLMAAGININAGGWLGGSGTLTGDTTIAGTIAPGDSIGTINVAGTYTQQSDSTYLVELDASGSDLIAVSGPALLDGGAVNVNPLGSYRLNSDYRILTASGGVRGEFDEVSMSSSFAFLTPELSYDTHNVFLTLTQHAFLSSAAQTPNQNATAEGIDSLGHGSSLWDALIIQDADAARSAFDSLSGEIHASGKSALIEDSRFLRDAVNDRLRIAFNNTESLGHSSGSTSQSESDADGYTAWGRPFGSWGGFERDGGAASLDASTHGVFLGADSSITDRWRLGVVAGYSHSSFDVNRRSSSGSSDSYQLALYGGAQWDKLGFRGGLSRSWHNVDARRAVVVPGFSEHLSSNYNARTHQIFGGLGYRIDLAAALLEPFVDLAHVNLHTNSFTEDGGHTALSGTGKTTRTTFSTVGLRASTALRLPATHAILHGEFGWRHTFNDVAPQSNHAFIRSDTFTIVGVPIAEDAAVARAGLDLTVYDGIFGLWYAGQFGSDVEQHSIVANVTMRF